MDGNLNDSSGNANHGVPPSIKEAVMWLDASDTSTIQLGSVANLE